MKRLRFDADVAFTPRDGQLEGVTIAPLSAPIVGGSPVQAAVWRVAPGGRMVMCGQWNTLVAVIEGSGEVSGATGVREPIAVGEAVFWEAGEEHETATATGLTALIIEGDGLQPFQRAVSAGD